ncbi:MAG: transporter substrate-binding domain-containing protein [Candidatus Fermentibacteria bacterium]|nr:transporter substrate-binding domain-containing protein [Candidatus Fermentibacteria bacterium]
MRGFQGILFVFLLAVSAIADSGYLTSEEEQYLRDNPEIRFVCQSRYPPFEFIGHSGEHQGMCIELVRWMSTEFGFQAILTDMTFQEAQEAVLSGEADVITSFFYSESRDINYEFTEPMYTIPARIYVLPVTTDIVSLTDLIGKRVAVQKGDYAIDFLNREGISCTLVEADDFADGVHLLLDGEVDALIGDEQIVDYHLLNHHTAGSVLAVGDTLYVGQNCMSVAEGNDVLFSIINKGIKHAVEKGITDGIAMKWQINPIAIPYKKDFRFLPHLLTILGFLLIVAVLIFSWNIRLRKVVERKTISLEESERRLDQALSQANLGSWDLNVQTGKVINNDQYSVMLGYSPGEIAFSHEGWMNRAHPDDRKNLVAYINEFIVVNTGRFECEYRMKTKEGDWVSIHSSGGIVERDADGKVVRIAGIHQDVTRRKHSEYLARKAVDDWENTFDAISEHIAVIDSEGAIIRVNKAQALALGLSRNECVGLNLHTLLYPDHGTSCKCIPVDYSSDGYHLPSQHQVYLKKFKGYFDVSLSVSEDSEDGSIKVVRIAKDISHRKQAEKNQKEMEGRVQHAQKLESLGVLAGGIAHDFNNILMSIRGYTDLAISTVKEEDQAYEYLKKINKSVGMASELSGQMLAYSGKGNFVVETVYLNDIIEKIKPMFQVSVSRKVDLVYNQGRDMPCIRVDSTQMEQVILNLVTNASEAIGAGRGTITVITGKEKRVHPDRPEEKEENDFVFFQVDDTGSGMSHDVVKKLFDPFFTTKFTGRGLGMAVVHGIVEGHNGFIEVHSEPGAGSSIKVFIPSVDENEKKSKKEVDDKFSFSGGTAGVLLVDDEKNILFIGELALKKSGYTVFTAVNGEEALEIYKRNSNEIQCIILDLTMPVMDGVECLKDLKKYDPEVKVILSSGYNQKDVESKIHIDDIAGYLKKPYGLNALREQVKNVMQR